MTGHSCSGRDLLPSLNGMDITDLQKLIYGLLDIYAITYSKVSTDQVMDNLDRCPNVATATEAGVLTRKGAPLPDTAKVWRLFNDYRTQSTAAMVRAERQKAAAARDLSTLNFAGRWR